MSDQITRGLLPVDALEVQVLVDNVTDSISTVPSDVTNETAVLIRNGSMPMSAGEYRCCAHHGLSLIITARIGGDRQTLVFDAGPEAYTVTRNGALLKVPFGDAGAVVLSHGHWDHAGGLVEVVRQITAVNNGRRVECHVNQGMFVPRGNSRHGGEPIPHKPVPSAQELAGAGAIVVNLPEARRLLNDCFYLSGEIPRVTPYEKGLPGHLRRTADGTSWEPDPWIMDERYVAAHVKGKGAIVFTACSHAGVINVLKDARKVLGDIPLHTVMGGFHLSGQQIEEIIPDTVNDMKHFGLTRIIPAHCTGWRAVGALVQAFGEGCIVPSAVGRQFRF